MGNGNMCQSCISRIPYATVVATLMCMLGVGIFCGATYRGTSLAIIMMDQVFHLRLIWIEAIQIIFVIIAATMVSLGLTILFVGFLATGSTRYKVYRAWRSRIGGRISAAVLMSITYILNLIWILIFCVLVITAFIFTIFWHMCESVQISKSCIDLTQFHFAFPPDVKLKVCETYEIKAFCKDGVENATQMFILSTISTCLIILSLIHYLICLSANYAHIKDHEKFQELEEIRHLNDFEYTTTSKDRF